MGPELDRVGAYTPGVLGPDACAPASRGGTDHTVNRLVRTFIAVAVIGWGASLLLTAIHFWVLPLPAGVEPQGAMAVITSPGACTGPIPLRALQRMLDEGEDCDQILREIGAASKALRCGGVQLAVEGVEQCVVTPTARPTSSGSARPSSSPPEKTREKRSERG